jgi:hypothetical protein
MATVENRKAIERAFYNGKRIAPGMVVTVPAGHVATWLEPPAATSPKPHEKKD